MNTDALVTSDLQALADASARNVPRLADTERRLEEALAKTPGVRRGRVLAVAVALGAGALVLPLPVWRTSGWDATLRSADGAVVTVHFSARDESAARRHALAIARGMGAEATVTAHRELAWRSVYAMARDSLFRIDVDAQGKSDAEVEAEIRTQLEQQGWNAGSVTIRRGDGVTAVEVGADRDGHHIQVLEKSTGPDADHVQIAPEPLDTTREPGMTDEQLRQKILAQLRARGMDGDVIVQGDLVQIRAEKSSH
jgi:hypothetical protein